MSNEAIKVLANLAAHGKDYIKSQLQDESMYEGLLEVLRTIEELKEEVGV